MLKSYTNIREKQAHLCKNPVHTENIIKLGRTVFSNFSKRKYKMERLNIPALEKYFSETIVVSRTNSGGWELYEEKPDKFGVRNLLTKIRMGHKLQPLLVWLVLNNLYDNKIRIKTNLNAAPVSEQELKKLFTDLKKFFPQKRIFNTPAGEALNSERMLKAFFIVNLCTARESKIIKEVHLVYSTNWGEIFCRPVEVSKKLQESPKEYLQEKMGSICCGSVEMTQFIPLSSGCPAIKIPVN